MNDSENKALELLHQVPTPPNVRPEVSERIYAAVVSRTRKRSNPVRKAWPVALVLLGGAAAFAAIETWWHRAPSTPQPMRHPVQQSTQEPVQPPVQLPVQLERRPQAVVESRTASNDTLVAESQLIGQAMQALRQRQDPRAALSSLALYRRRYPRGQLAQEATILKVEAHLAEDDTRSALETLDATRSQKPELSTLKAELLLRARRPAEALLTFEKLKAGPLTPPLEERVLFGLWSAQKILGQQSAAEVIAREYLDRYPAGRFSDRISH